MKFKTITKTIEKQIVTSKDGTHTYELNIRPHDAKSDKRAIIIMLYHTRSENNLLHADSTLGHILSHTDDIDVGNVTVYNLFNIAVLLALPSHHLRHLFATTTRPRNRYENW